MICPYAVNRKQITQTQMQYDDEGKQTHWMEIQTNTAFFVECKQEGCGAWKDGQCCYKSNEGS